MITIQDIKQILIDSMESDLPDGILYKLSLVEGKMYYKRTIDMLNTEFPGNNFTKLERIGRLSLQWGLYPDYSFLYIIDPNGPAKINCDWIEKENPAHFVGRRERNNAREALLDDNYTLEEIVSKANRILVLKSRLGEMTKEFTSLLNIHSAETYAIKGLIGA